MLFTRPAAFSPIAVPCQCLKLYPYTATAYTDRCSGKYILHLTLFRLRNAMSRKLDVLPKSGQIMKLVVDTLVIIVFMEGQACFLFLNPQDAFGPSISSSVVLFSFVLLVYIVVLVLVFYLCPSSVRVVATFLGTVLFPLLCSLLPFFP